MVCSLVSDTFNYSASLGDLEYLPRRYNVLCDCFEHRVWPKRAKNDSFSSVFFQRFNCRQNDCLIRAIKW